MHVLQTLQKSRYLSENLKAVVDPVIERNAYFAHHENILLCMIGDERKWIRELTLRRILKARSEKYGLRQYGVPKLNFNANDYIDLIDWQQTIVSEPPLLADISQEEVENFVSGHNFPIIDFPKSP